jgi:methylenetetrahydrofolate reductase (NADPH)
VELVALVADHPERPELIGVAGYPEGHPLISDEQLERAQRAKGRLADYVVTQMCFEAQTLRGWIEREREQGMSCPRTPRSPSTGALLCCKSPGARRRAKDGP